jgi:hypothetical protein
MLPFLMPYERKERQDIPSPVPSQKVPYDFIVPLLAARGSRKRPFNLEALYFALGIRTVVRSRNYESTKFYISPEPGSGEPRVIAHSSPSFVFERAGSNILWNGASPVHLSHDVATLFGSSIFHFDFQ